jgi:membrane-bound lytic murein transglycosylase A
MPSNFLSKPLKLAVPVVCFLGLLFGCVAPPPVVEPTPETAMSRVSPGSLPDFQDDLNYDGLAHSIEQSLRYLHKLPEQREFVFGPDRWRVAHVIRSLEEFLAFIRKNPSTDQLRDHVRTHYIVYQSIGRDTGREVLFTGYFEPHLRGRLEKSPDYRYPIYARPRDLLTIDLSLFSGKYRGEKLQGRLDANTVVPYYDRRQIDYEQALSGIADPLVWVADPVDVFFLQIQGSGKVYLEDGGALNIHYDTTNGHPYRSIGKLLIDEEKISREEMSMQKIRVYLNAHPERVPAVLSHNPSYVFFKIEPEGPLGAINVKLTPGRSLATDRRLFPPAAVAFIETEKPTVDGRGRIQSWQPFSRFVLNQDTGGAIRGPGRADLFWGNGPYAEIAAGHMKQPGRMFFLVLQPDSP